MIISDLSLHHFRNYQELHLELDPNLNIFVGQNAQGKTNIAESIFFLALTRSHRTHTDKDLITWGEKEMRVSAHVLKKNMTIPLEVSLTNKGRIAKANHLKRLENYDQFYYVQILSSYFSLLMSYYRTLSREGRLDKFDQFLYP